MWLGGPWGWKFQEQCLGHLSNDQASVSSFTIRVSQSTAKGQVSTVKKWKIQTASMDTASNSGGSWASYLFGEPWRSASQCCPSCFKIFNGIQKKNQKMQMLKYWKWHCLGWCILSRDETMRILTPLEDSSAIPPWPRTFQRVDPFQRVKLRWKSCQGKL